MSQVDGFRRECMRSVADIEARTIPWSGYRDEMKKILGASPTEQEILKIGSNLKRIFKSELRGRAPVLVLNCIR